MSTMFSVFGSLLEILPSTSSAENVRVQGLVELIASHGVGGGAVTACNDPRDIPDPECILLTID